MGLMLIDSWNSQVINPYAFSDFRDFFMDQCKRLHPDGI
jgi:hypothetical protein